MLRYLKIFSWFLFTFGVVGVGAVVFGVDIGIGTSTGALGAMLLQVFVSGAILYGFKLNQVGKLPEKTLMYGGWIAILALVIIGQVWLSQAQG